MMEPPRVRLPSERFARTATLVIVETFNTDGLARGPLQLTVIAGEYDDGRIGEIFVEAGKQGTKVSGLVSAVCSSISVGLQYGIPLRVFYEKLAFTRFPPDGRVIGPRIRPLCTSILDAIFQWLEASYDLDSGLRRYENQESRFYRCIREDAQPVDLGIRARDSV